jgi:hypothetical protein
VEVREGERGREREREGERGREREREGEREGERECVQCVKNDCYGRFDFVTFTSETSLIFKTAPRLSA